MSKIQTSNLTSTEVLNPIENLVVLLASLPTTEQYAKARTRRKLRRLGHFGGLSNAHLYLDSVSA